MGLAPDKKGAKKLRARLAFWDESGISQKPTVRHTWSPRGVTPAILSTGRWKSRSVVGVITATPLGHKPKLFARIFRRTIRSREVIQTIRELRRHIKGTLVLMWDGLGSYTSQETRQFLKTQRFWLRVYSFPPYAPDLNPPEYLWSCGKNKDFVHLYVDTPEDLDIHIQRYKRRIRRKPDLLTGFIKKSSLFPELR